MSDTDLELLARYTRHHAEEAFAEIVRRHLDLVHSAALRQVRSPQLAEEVAQCAFLKLARHARQLASDTILSAWLYQVTRREAIDVARREASRQLREQVAIEMNTMNATAADWTHIEPLLDDAMHALDETDRAAVLLRYFENKSLREVGDALGASENAAQKRLSRAVERLREFFAKRGITVGTSGLVVVVSANAIQAAPVGLALTISTAAALTGTTVAATAAATATKAIAMTTLQKTIIAGALAGAVGTGIYEAHQVSTLRSQNETLRQEQSLLAEQIQQLSLERDEVNSQLASLAGDSERLNLATVEIFRLRDEVNLLRGNRAGPPQPAGGMSDASGRGGVGTIANQAQQDIAAGREEEMRQLGLAASRGDFTALQKLNELSQMALKGRTNVNQGAYPDIRIAFKVIGEEAGKGNDTAFEALWRATRMDYLKGAAMYALGDAAAMGNEKALEPLLDPKRYLLSNSSTTGALVPAAKIGNVKAIEYLAAVGNDPKKQAEWYLVTEGLKNPAAAGNATAIDALAAIGRSEREMIRTAALRALENAAFNNHPKAIEALRSLGYQ